MKTFKQLTEDEAFKNVVARLQAKHGKDAVITKKNPIKPPSEEQKKKNYNERVLQIQNGTLRH